MTQLGIQSGAKVGLREIESGSKLAPSTRLNRKRDHVLKLSFAPLSIRFKTLLLL